MDPPPPEAPEVAQSDEQAFIQRILTLSWHSTETNNDPETREELIVEIEGYLESKGEDEVRVSTLVRLRWRAKAYRQSTELRGALNALKEHRKNVSRRRQAERKLRDFEARALKAENGSNLLQA